MMRFLIFLAIMAINSPAMAAFGFWALGGGPGTPSGCTWTGNIAGSCLPSTDTSDQIVAPRPSAAGVSDTFGFGGSQNLLLDGGGFDCGSSIMGGGATDCSVTTRAVVCATPGNVASNTHPWSNEGVVSWLPTGVVSYNPRNNGTWQSGIPAFHPPMTIESTTGSQSVGAPTFQVSFMSAVCGTNTNAFFVDGLLGNMPNLKQALKYMGSNDTLTVAAQPAGFPFWPGGGNGGIGAPDNLIGPVAGSTAPVYNVTVAFDPASKFAYPLTNKGFLDVENNGTTITGGTVFWVNPGNNQAAIAWDAGLDLTVTGFYGDTAGMGLFRATIRQGITTFTDDIFANIGCMDGACAYGHNHNIYLGTVPSGGFDQLLATNLSDPDVLENGWNLKLRTPNSLVTQSFFGSRVNNGTSSAHGAIDYPCGGTHSTTFSALEVNQYSLNSTISNQQSNFLVSSGEERGTNAVTTVSGAPTDGSNCPTTMWAPNSTAITATVTGPSTFTTTTNPATFVPLFTFNTPNSAAMWDLGVSGLMANGPANVFSWTGPTAGVYTVQLDACFNGEGTIPLEHPGLSIYACFVGTGAITLYATGGVVPLLSNTPTTASISVPIDPAKFGIVVGDSPQDNSNTLTITSITGSGPYTIAMSCAHASFLGGPNCIFPTINWQSVPVASGTYNSGTGAVSLTLAADVGLTNGSSVNIGGLFGTGAVSSLNGTFTATSGTTGTTLNYTAATGLTLTIGGSGGSGSGVTNTGAVPATLDSMRKSGPVQLTANTTGGACDGVNLLCGLTNDPRAYIVWHGEQVIGTGVGAACMTAGQIASIQPAGGSTGAGFSNGQTVTLAGGTFETAAVVTVASSSGGHITGVTVTTPGVYSAFAKTFTQGATSGGGTGAQFQFPRPAPIVTGSGPYTLRLAQASGAACITSAVSGQVYQVQTPTNITWDHNIIGWDGGCPNAGACQLLHIENAQASELATISNSIVWTNVATRGPAWTTTGGANTLDYGMTDGGGNVRCNNRVDLGTSARCAIPPFTAASFTGNITGTALTANCSGSCMTISSGTYNNSTGLVTLTVSGSNQIPYGADSGSGQVAFTVSGLTGTGAFASLNGNQIATSATTGTTLTYLALPGLGASTVTGGNINPLSGAAACRPGMYVWDNAGQFTVGVQGHTISGTRIVSGTSPNFVVSIPPGGVVSTDIANTTLSCGWGMPAAAFNGTIDGSGVLTINSGLVGSVHNGDYFADSSGTLPDNIKATSGSGTTWQTTYSGGGVSAEYMVSVAGSPATAPGIYIDPTAAGGGTGTINSPYNTWASVTPACGTVFYQKKGTTWTGSIVIPTVCTVSAPITLTSYGSGAQPIILGSVALSGAYTVVKDFSITNSGGNALTATGTANHVQFIGNTIPGGNSGILIDVSTGSGILVAANTISSVANVCITTEGSTAALGATTVTGNTISNCGFDGIEVLGNYGSFTNNTITAWGQLHTGTSGIHVFTTSGVTGLGQFNTITGNVATLGVDTTGQDGVGFELDQWTSHNTVSGNFGFGNNGACLSLFDADHNTVSGNTCVSNARNGGGSHTFLAEESLNSGLGLTTNNANSGNILLPTTSTNYAVYVDGTSVPPAGNTFATDTYQNISGAGNVYNVNGTLGSSQVTWNTFFTATDSFTGVPLTHQPTPPPAYDFAFPPSFTFTIDGVSRTLVGWTRGGGLYYQ